VRALLIYGPVAFPTCDADFGASQIASGSLRRRAIV
jgi:hypothetical protein